MQADKNQILRLLKTARGQMDGIVKMVEEDRYCIDISNQILASQAILTRANKEVLKAHIFSCVANASKMQTNCCDGSNDNDYRKKLEEINTLFDKLL